MDTKARAMKAQCLSLVSSGSLTAPQTQHVWKSPYTTAPVDGSATTEQSEARQADISGAMGRLEQVRQNKGSQGRAHFGIFVHSINVVRLQAKAKVLLEGSVIKKRDISCKFVKLSLILYVIIT